MGIKKYMSFQFNKYVLILCKMPLRNTYSKNTKKANKRSMKILLYVLINSTAV